MISNNKTFFVTVNVMYYSVQYVQDEVLSGHSGPVNCLAGITQHSDAEVTTTVVSGSSDFTVKVWKRAGREQFQLVQTLSSESGFVLGVDLCCLQHHLMLACGTDTGKVEVHVQQKDDVVSDHVGKLCVC